LAWKNEIEHFLPNNISCKSAIYNWYQINKGSRDKYLRKKEKQIPHDHDGYFFFL
jgi:hypothetical protein